MSEYPPDYVPPDLRRDDIDLPRQNDSTCRDAPPTPLTKDDTSRHPDDRLAEYGITREEAGFMKAVVKAMNGELDGYNLTESMTQIKELYDIDEDKLQEKGYVKRHSGVARRVYYSVTPEGQKACYRTKKHGFRVGDAGDDTPHRVGVELAKQCYEQRDDVRFIEISPRENGSKTDLVVVSTDFDRIATIEVEGGRVSADLGVPEDASSGINDYSSLRHDYRVLAAADGESVWVVRNHEVYANLLRALTAGDAIDVDVGRETLRGIENGRVKVGAFSEGLDAPGIDTVLTFQQLRNRL